MPVEYRIVRMRCDVAYVLYLSGLSDERIQGDAVQCILEQLVHGFAELAGAMFLFGSYQKCL